EWSQRFDRRIAGPNQNHSVLLSARIGPHAIGKLALAEIRNVYALACGIIGPAVIAATDGALVDDPFGEWDLSMSAAVLQRKDRSVFRPHQHDRLARKVRRVSLARLEFVRPGQRVPVVRMRADLTKINAGWAAEAELRVVGHSGFLEPVTWQNERDEKSFL